MKAVRIHEDGGPEVLRYEDAPDPAPGPGEVLVRLAAASLNHLDVWMRQGMPSVPEAADPRRGRRRHGRGGRRGGEGFEAGQAVVLNPGLDDGAHIIGEHCDGTHAELIVVPAEYVRPEARRTSTSSSRPRSRSSTRPRTGCSSPGRALREGEWVLAWGVGSGVGSAAFLLAKALGARVVVTSGSDEKLERALALGADARRQPRDGRRRPRRSRRSPAATASTSSSSTSARRPGRRRCRSRLRRAGASRSAARRAVPIRPPG